MTRLNVNSVHRVLEPEEWPTAPTWMTFTTLQNVLSCPRRWALQHGQYPEIWDGDGYPRRLAPAALWGQVVHESVAVVLSALSEAGCSSVRSSKAVQVMKELGGFSKVVRQQLRATLKEIRENPRMVGRDELLEEQLRAKVPAMRGAVQGLVARANVVPRAQFHSVRDHREQVRASLGAGTYTELWLQATTIGWGGYIDLLVVKDQQATIVDFKTGAPKDNHAEQVRLYSVLWWLDETLNPSKRPVQELRLEYPDKTVHIEPPTREEREAIADDLKQRRTTVQSVLEERPPPAYPSHEQCSWCNVRHLCTTYWKPETQSQMADEKTEPERYEDTELQLLEQTTPGRWRAQVRRSKWWKKGTKAHLIRTHDQPPLHSESVVRVLGAQARLSEKNEIVELNEGGYSEVYVVN